jgi:hypothetical protein
VVVETGTGVEAAEEVAVEAEVVEAVGPPARIKDGPTV